MGSRQVKTFDELCGEVCSELRGAGKSIDLCEKIKVFQSDLKRVQILLEHHPHVVNKFTNSIGTRYEGKDEGKSRQLLCLAKSLPTTQNQRAIELLTRAVCLSPWRKSDKLSQDEINEFFMTEKVNEDCVEWVVKMIENNCDCKADEKMTKEGNEEEAPLENGHDSKEMSVEDLLSNIYFERCSRLCQEGKYESAILDCVRGVICWSGKRKKLTFTTVSVVGASLKGMGYFPQATLVFNHSLQLLRLDSNLDNQAKSTHTINIVKALKHIQLVSHPPIQPTSSVIQQSNQGEPKQNILQLFGQAHPHLIAASNALDLKYDETRGRHVVAKTTIPAGATLIVDTPYSWSLCPPLYGTLCQHCCKKVVSGIPCQHCSSVAFCQWNCWKRSEHYHKFECAILKGLDSSETLGEMALLCYRTVCKTDVRVVQNYGSQVESDDKEIKMSDIPLSSSDWSDRDRSKLITLGLDVKTNKLDPTQFSSIFALTTNSKQRPAGDIVKRILAAIYLTLCLRYTGYFQNSQAQAESDSLEASCLPKNEEEESETLSNVELETAAFILRLSQSLSCNAYGINSPVSQHNHSTQLLGGASYPTISIINHSCNPNVFRLTSGNICIVRSILEIQKGEEIFDSYGPLFTTMPKLDRKSILQSQYFFNCDCSACEETWPLFKDLKTTQASRVGEEKSYKCPGCRKMGMGTSSKKDKMKKSCPNCGHKFDLYKIGQILAASEKNYLAAKDSLISRGEMSPQQETAFTHHLSILQKFLTSPHKLIVECQETLKLAWNVTLLNSQS